MISNGEVITSDERMDDLVEVMLGDRFPIDFDLGNSPYPDLFDVLTDDYDYEPDVDEAQEWHDFDPDC